MIRVFINGYLGKMGSKVVSAVEKEHDLTLVGKADHEDDLKAMLKKTKPEVVIDFTHPDAVKKNALIILKAGCYGVIGTTGLSEADLKELEQVAKENKTGILVCPNFAIGAVLMMRFAADAAKYMPRVEIIELHHDKKADAPSGTALKTAELIYKTNSQINRAKLDEKESIKGVRGGAKHRIPIHSLRLPGLVAHQEVLFGGLGQVLTIRHDAITRDSFMPGVILGVRKVKKIKGLVYGLENIL